MSQAGDLDLQQNRLEQGNVALIQQDAALLQLLSQDAAGLTSHQVKSSDLFCAANEVCQASQLYEAVSLQT